MEWITLVYVEVVADERDRVKCPTKRYKFISYMSLDFMSRIGKPLGYFDFLLGWRRPREASCDLTYMPVQRRRWRNFSKS